MNDKQRSETKKNIDKEIKSEVCESDYTGQTRRTLKQRMGEPELSVNSKEEKSWIYKHAVETRGNKFNFISVKISQQKRGEWWRPG